MSGPRADDRGAAAVAMVGVLVAVMALVAVIVGAAQGLSSRSLARAGADHAALAAALVARDAWALAQPAQGVACAAAHEAARLNGVVVTGCVVEGAVATVSVTAGAGLTSASAQAKAGPQWSGTSRGPTG
ncbi:hypothetical protein ON058_00220 [Demequina sp. B12]|uniref:hypothetical protein n=1 Tax=Demequina sp. B12 TaxID=2992757 RepID=UPI00237BB41C|nr:hypothetical protein [Demequina sp. B12]MDE0571839.1 hypothetical protein [Demequina sp. B12]